MINGDLMVIYWGFPGDYDLMLTLMGPLPVMARNASYKY